MSKDVQQLETIIIDEMSNDNGFGVQMRAFRKFNDASYEKLIDAVREYINLVDKNPLISREVASAVVILVQILESELSHQYVRTNDAEKISKSYHESLVLLNRLLGIE